MDSRTHLSDSRPRSDIRFEVGPLLLLRSSLLKRSLFRYIVTSDRDEKIKVSNYPATHDIEAFCVGHKEFVSSVTFFNQEKFLVSASGDKTLRLWNYETGQQSQLIEMSFIPITVVILEASGLMAISSDDNTMFIHRYTINKDGLLSLELLGQKSYPSSIEFRSFGDSVIVEYFEANVSGEHKLLLDKITTTETKAHFEQLCDVTEALSITLEASFKIVKSFDVSLLFKNSKNFDNVKQYIDRKKARIEKLTVKK